VLVIGLLGGSLFLLAGALSLLLWAVAGPIAGVLLGGWFGGEMKKRLDRVSEKGKETKVVRFRRKAELESSVSELRGQGWEPKWESYRETQTGLAIRRITYSVVMERAQQLTGRRGLKRFLRLILPSK